MFEPSVYLFSLAAIIIVIVLCVPFLMLMTASPLCEVIRYKEEEYFIDENTTLRPFPSLLERRQVNLTVVVPAYNEEVRLEPMLDEALDFLVERQRNIPHFSFEIIIVNDGSSHWRK